MGHFTGSACRRNVAHHGLSACLDVHLPNIYGLFAAGAAPIVGLGEFGHRQSASCSTLELHVSLFKSLASFSSRYGIHRHTGNAAHQRRKDGVDRIRGFEIVIERLGTFGQNRLGFFRHI